MALFLKVWSLSAIWMIFPLKLLLRDPTWRLETVLPEPPLYYCCCCMVLCVYMRDYSRLPRLEGPLCLLAELFFWIFTVLLIEAFEISVGFELKYFPSGLLNMIWPSGPWKFPDLESLTCDDLVPFAVDCCIFLSTCFTETFWDELMRS